MSIKEFAKKSLVLRNTFRSYTQKLNQPSWKHLLKENQEIWDSALKRSAEGQKILIASSVGGNLAGTILESTLAIALSLRGAAVDILLCDSVLPACLACWIGWFQNQKRFADNGPAKDLCNDCFKPAYKMYSSLGIPVHRYSDFLSPDDIKKADDIASSVPFDEVRNYVLNGIAIGEHALAGALRFYARGDIYGESHSKHILRRYLKASLLTTFMMNNLLDQFHYESAVFNHGIYVPQGLIGEICRKEKVRVVNWNPGYKNKSFIFSHGDTYHHTMVSEPEDKWINISWNDDLESELASYLKSRWKGTRDWIWFHNKPEFEMQKIMQETGIDFSKPCIGMLTSVMWDAVLHYPSNAFSHMFEWIKGTIDYFITRPDLQLIIRIHPAEIRGTLPSRQKMMDKIEETYTNLPENIIIIPPESRVSTYVIMSKCDTVIIYNTKTGIELAAEGIPVIVAGEAWIRNKGFAMDVDNPESYLKLLDTLPLGYKMSDEKILKAKKYAYHFFFRRMIPIEFMVPTGTNPPYKAEVSDLNDLMPGATPGLDVICDGIMNASDFIYISENNLPITPNVKLHNH